MKNRIFVLCLILISLIFISGCRKRSRNQSIDLAPKHEVKILDEKKDDLIIKSKPSTSDDYTGVVEIEKPEYQE